MIDMLDQLTLKAVYHDFGRWELLYLDGESKVFPSRWFKTKEELEKFVEEHGMEEYYVKN